MSKQGLIQAIFDIGIPILGEPIWVSCIKITSKRNSSFLIILITKYEHASEKINVMYSMFRLHNSNVCPSMCYNLVDYNPNLGTFLTIDVFFFLLYQPLQSVTKMLGYYCAEYIQN